MMLLKMQSVGNLIAVASYKPNFVTGRIDGDVGALGRIAVGEILETVIVRLFEFQNGRMGREIPAVVEATEWNPWEVVFQGKEFSVRRSTTWTDEHVQQWQFEDGGNELVVWLEFETRMPGKWRQSKVGNSIEWIAATGDMVSVATDGQIGPVAASRDPADVRRKLESGESDLHAISAHDRWYRGVVAWVRTGSSTGTFALTTTRHEIASETKCEAIVKKPQAIVEASRRGWEAFYANDIPPCPRSDAMSKAIWNDAWFVLRANRMDYSCSPLNKSFGSPSKFNYHHQWLWDSGFHSIAWRWANDGHWAQDETANLFDNQLEQGRICHEIFYSQWRREDAWPSGHGAFAPTSQPPVLAMAVEKVFERTRDRVWLAQLYPRLRPYLTWWSTVRDPDGDGLAGWANGYESGLDDSPRWDHITREGNAFYASPLEATELNALLVNEWRAVANLARLLGHDSDAVEAEQNGRRIKTAMRQKLWNERDGFFYCRDHEEKSIPIKTIGGLLGLLALEAGDREIKPLISHLTDEGEFWTQYPVPSVAVTEKTFERGQMWRGPTWINTNWLLIRALQRLGEIDVARELSERTLKLVVAEGSPKLWEWYNPISGKALGNMEYGWSTLVIDLMMDPM